MLIIRKAHKWIGLILGLQLALWMLSGLAMAVLPHHEVAGEHRASDSPAMPALGPVSEELKFPAGTDQLDIRQVRLRTFEGRLVFETATAEGAALFDAVSGSQVEIGEPLAIELARRDYVGPGTVSRTEFIPDPTLEIRDHAAPAWRVNFNDPEQTSIYISAETGRVLERRNNYWRVFDTFWMLHIMDYQNRSNFNNPLIIIAALVAFWLGLSGIVLWWDSFRRRDFDLLAKWRNRTSRLSVSLKDSEGSAVASFDAKADQSLYLAMEEQGYPLPSSCGGGGTCGLCRVRISPETAISTADRRQIPEPELSAGYRLACQHRVDTALSVILPHGLLDAKTFPGKIVSSRFIAPDMYELRVTLPQPLEFRAGSYVQIEIPPFKSHLDKLDLPERVKAQWEASGTAKEFGTDKALYRTYSLANSPRELGNDILLNVRLVLAKPDMSGVPVGIGSAYLATISAGETIILKGPFGDFHVYDDESEIVFIGGGAGIAPIRSMIRDQLVSQGRKSKISFWYGARTQDDIVYEGEFAHLVQTCPNFSWHVALSNLAEGDPWAGNRGWIHEVVRDQHLASHPDISSCRFYVCGPPVMLDAVLTLLKSLGVSEEKIAFDDFGI